MYLILLLQIFNPNKMQLTNEVTNDWKNLITKLKSHKTTVKILIIILLLK